MLKTNFIKKIPLLFKKKERTEASLKSGGDMMLEAFEIYKQHWRLLLSISSAIFVPSILVSVFSEKSIVFSIIDVFGIPATLLLGIILLILFVIISSWGQITLMHVAQNHHITSVSNAFAFAWNKIGSYWWIAFLTGFFIFGGIILFVVPGLIFALWFSMAYFVLISEDEKGINALLKSREYVKGRTWSVFWRFLVLIFYNILFSALFGIVFLIFPKPWENILSQNVSSLLVMPFSMVYLSLIYKDLVRTKGAFSFAPSKGTKRVFWSIGALGVMLPIILVILVGWITKHDLAKVPMNERSLNFVERTMEFRSR